MLDLSHLAPTTVVYTIAADGRNNKPERRYYVHVFYSDHCYTKAMAKGKRVFDERRYELSKLLPNIISILLERKCSFANGQNYYTVEFVAGNEEYEVYFELYKQQATKELHLMVHSAYVRDKGRLKDRPRWETIRFSVILFNTLTGKKLQRKK